MREQFIIRPDNNYSGLDEYIDSIGAEKAMIVLDRFAPALKIYPHLKKLKAQTVEFTDYSPNPDYDSVKKGTQIFLSEKCGCIIAIGGGSSMDVAKCIKLFAVLEQDRELLEQPLKDSAIPLIAMPTTAGSGSEATRYAVIYRRGEKQSVTHESCIPDAVIFDPSVLETLPLYQKKSCMLDALCHGIESMWSVNSDDESREYSKSVILTIMENYKAYISGDETASEKMLEAANKAGKAINITQTTAGHAMSYKLTKLYNIAHGHAAALCLYGLLDFTADHIEKCVDKRGVAYFESVLSDIARCMGCTSIKQTSERFYQLLNELELFTPERFSNADIETLSRTVNTTRLKNNPIALTTRDIEGIYRKILCSEENI